MNTVLSTEYAMITSDPSHLHLLFHSLLYLTLSITLLVKPLLIIFTGKAIIYHSAGTTQVTTLDIVTQLVSLISILLAMYVHTLVPGIDGYETYKVWFDWLRLVVGLTFHVGFQLSLVPHC